MKRYFALAVSVLFAVIATAQNPSLDDQYVRIFTVIQQADSLAASQPAEALTKYREAQDALQTFQKANPNWNSQVVNFRLGYIADKVAALSAKPAAPAPAVAAPSATPAAPAPVPAANAAPADWANQIGTLKDQVNQLQAERGTLETKLKEALAMKPETDPRELAKAQENVSSLQKQNDLLKAALDNEKSKPAPVMDTKALDQAKQDLAAANSQLAQQKEAAAKALADRDALQTKMQPLTTEANASATLRAENEQLKKQLGTARNADEKARAMQTQLTSVESERDKLRVENAALENRLKAFSQDNTASALRSENEDLKKQLAALKTVPAPAAAPAANATDTPKKLAQAQAEIALLQSDQEKLRLEKTALENRVKQLMASTDSKAAAPAPVISTPPPAAKDASSTNGATVSSSVMPPAAESDNIHRIKQLEGERDALQKKLEAANKKLYGRKGKTSAGQVEDLENQLASVRARLEAFEARAVPYTPEEMAMLKQPAGRLAQAQPASGKKAPRELPAGSSKLVSEAQGYFAAHEYDKAETAYQQVLRMDEKNVTALANLAAIQLEAQHYDAAEANLKKALAVEPDDAYSQYMLGALKYREGKYDEAVDTLSRVSKLDPQNADLQTYLGLALSRKGQRGPAEAALRKAILIQPNNASAHYNLALVYASQQPPATELARFHYQKALAAGHPSNPELAKKLDQQ